ncbi:hypothetical protein PLICRDRAFT_38367 [Plicaturopsis crispa FD-325 SS-3]|nr:hypothetical protein PLICRDRAFT_38367 [Plicaturopsis crispa FD-325 SS-3]
MNLLPPYFLRAVCIRHPPRRWSAVASNLSARRLTTKQEVENTNVGHSRFLAEAKATSKWKDELGSVGEGGIDPTGEDFKSIANGRGKLSPTSSHLVKLILPLGNFTAKAKKADGTPTKVPPPTVILLHPSQPLSHASRLILATLAPANPSVSFRSVSPTGQHFQWSDSTDVGDFIRDAARAAKFFVCITSSPTDETIIDVEVPTFADRTRYLRRKLELTTSRLKEMEGLKRACDREAHRGARRMALSGFGMLVVYWATVARLTFWDYGWDVMEPITYLSGLSSVICGYLWFLYQGREVSYTSVLDSSVSSRREALYKARGLDVELWMDLQRQAKALRAEIARIAEDYDEDRTPSDDSSEVEGRSELPADSEAEAKTKKAEDDAEMKAPGPTEQAELKDAEVAKNEDVEAVKTGDTRAAGGRSADSDSTSSRS